MATLFIPISEIQADAIIVALNKTYDLGPDFTRHDPLKILDGGKEARLKINTGLWLYRRPDGYFLQLDI